MQLEVGNVTQYDRFNLVGVKEYFDASERRLAGPVVKEAATFFALECRDWKNPNVEIYIEFDSDIAPDVIFDMLMMNEHIAKCGIGKLY